MPPKAVMYSQALCGFCAAARSLLESKGIAVEEIDVTMDPHRRREMQSRSGRRTVPQIFIGDTHVGGYQELAALEEHGELDAMIGNA